MYINHNLRLLSTKPLNKPSLIQTVSSQITTDLIDENNIDMEDVTESKTDTESFNGSINMEATDASMDITSEQDSLSDISKFEKKDQSTTGWDSSDSYIDEIIDNTISKKNNNNHDDKPSNASIQQKNMKESMDTIKIGDFVVIQMYTKKLKIIKHYVGIIEQKLSFHEYMIKFMRKKSTYSFIFPLNEEISTVNFEEIKCVLSQPTIDRRELYTFQDDLTTFPNLY